MKKRLLAALLAAGLLLLSGCELVSVNRDRDKAQVVATVGGVVITKAELYEMVANELASQQYAIDPWDEKMDSELRASVDELMVSRLDAYVEELVVKLVCERDYPLTEEEEKELADQSKSYFDFIKLMLGYDEADPSAYEGDIEKDVDDYLASQGSTRESFAKVARLNFMYSKVRDALTKDVSATDAQVLARYQKDLESQKNAYATGAKSGYEKAVTQSDIGDYTLYKPVDYAFVRHILIMYTDAQKQRFDDAQADIDDAFEDQDTVQSAYDTAKAAVSAAQAEILTVQKDLDLARQNNDAAKVSQYQGVIDADKAIVSAQTLEMNKQAALLVKMNANVQKAEQAMATLQAILLKAHRKTVDTIMAKLLAGESFESLMEQYNEDGGKQSGAMHGVGYLVSPDDTTYDPAFKSAAFSMNTRGQVSDPVMSQFGVHILYMMYTPQEEVDLPYDLVKYIVKAGEDATVIDEFWENKVQELQKQFTIKKWPNRVKFLVR
jgi:hypothetical protein